MISNSSLFSHYGDDDFERVAIEAPKDSTRVLIETRIPEFDNNLTERIEASAAATSATRNRTSCPS